MGGKIRYLVFQRNPQSYRIRKFRGKNHDYGFNCLVDNKNEKIAKSDADKICAALNFKEAGRTVRAKRPVQQRKGKSLLCGYTGGCILRYKGKCTKSPGEVICGHRKPSPVA